MEAVGILRHWHVASYQTSMNRTERVSDNELKVSVQRPMQLGAKVIPGFVQVDSVVGGENQWSSNPDALRAIGYEIPTKETLLTLPQGQYTLAEAKRILALRNIEVDMLVTA